MALAVIFGFLFLMGLIAFGIEIWNFFFGHKWKYRNPADRTCTKCGQIENQYCQSLEDFYKPGKSWWEIHSDGKPGVCRHIGGTTQGAV